jgi:hypothetical protein
MLFFIFFSLSHLSLLWQFNNQFSIGLKKP